MEIQSDDQSSAHLGQDLGPGEIRLLFIRLERKLCSQHAFPWIGARKKIPKLVTRRVRLEDYEDFDAVSYVWGTAPASIPVSCNGSLLLVTPSAYEMLEHLAQFERWLWIDAICIDQQNSTEKEIQIPLMRKIYAQASTVSIWMGPSTPATEHFMDNFTEVLKAVENWDFTVEEDHNPAKSGSLWPWIDEKLYTGMYHILNHEWFRRLWTFQEVVLGRGSRIICGRRWIPGFDFFNFIAEGHKGTGKYLHFWHRPAGVVGFSATDYFRALGACNMICWSHKALHVHDHPVFSGPDIAKNLVDIQELVVKEPVDRVWAISSLLPQRVQDVIMPMVDYSIHARLAHRETYLKFCTAVISAQESLTLLSYPRSVQRDSSALPSWCPDFSVRPICSPRIRARWNDEISAHSRTMSDHFLSKQGDDENQSSERRCTIKNHALRFISTTPHTHTLQVRGFVLDTVVEVVETPLLRGRIDHVAVWKKEWANQDPVHVAKLQSLNRFISLSKRLVPNSSGCQSQIPIELLMVFWIDCRVRTDLGKAFQDGMACIRDGKDKMHALEPKRKYNAQTMIRRLMSMVDHAFFTTSNGRLGTGIPGIKPGDKICAFYGQEELYILRGPSVESPGDEADAEPVEFCGVAFVPHLMEQHERDSAKQGHDVIFKIK